MFYTSALGFHIFVIYNLYINYLRMATESGRNMYVWEVYRIYNVIYSHIFNCICWLHPHINWSLHGYGLFKKWCLYIN